MADPIARDTLLDELQGAQDKGARVYTFDPDSSPQEKAAVADKAASQVKSKSISNGSSNGSAGKAVPITTANAGPPVKPTITPEIAEDATAHETASPEPASPVEAPTQPPGALTDAAPEIPDWYKVGWRAVSGVDNPVAVAEERDKNVLASFISEQYYGQWFHNAGVIFFAVLSTYFLTLFRFGWGWLFIILAGCSTYYSNSITTLRRAARDDIQRELVKNRLVKDHESADWMNNFLDRFWLIYEPVLSKTVVASVDQVLSMSTPAFLDSLKLSTFTLGTKAPRIDKVRTFPHTDDDEVIMDWGISFTSTDLADMSPSQAAGKTNSRIVLEIRLGKGFAGVTMPILVEKIEFSGEMRIKLKLMSNFPHVKTVDLSFMSKPTFNYALKPVGGEFGVDINSIPGLQNFIRDTVHSVLGPMMYNPNVFTLNLEQMLSGEAIDAATGVLQLKIESARGLMGAKLGGGTPDPYVSVAINNRAEIAKTKFKRSTVNPHFGSTHNILLNDGNMAENLTISVFDHNDRRKDTLLGTATFELSTFLRDAVQEGITVKILREGKEVGDVVFSAFYYPVLKPKVVGDIAEPIPETKVGIVRLTLHQAKELDHSKSMSSDLNPKAKVLLQHHIIHQTPTYKHTLAPVWESGTDLIVTDRTSCVVTVKVVDDRDLLSDPVVGYLAVDLDYLIKAKEEQIDWFPLSGCKSGKVRMSAEWKPLAMAGSVQGAAAYLPPIGVVRLWLQKAVDVKNVEAALGGKSDPYVRVLMNGSVAARTEVINNNLNPEWDQIVYVPVHNLQEVLILEAMDYQHMTKDRSLGYVELHVKELAKQNADDHEYPFQSTGKKADEAKIRIQGETYKGVLHYIAEFIPAFNLRGLTFESAGTEMDRVQGDGEEESGEDVGGAEGEAALDTDTDDGLNIVTVRAPLPKREGTNGTNGTNGGLAPATPTKPTADDRASVKTTSTRATKPPASPTAAKGPEPPVQSGFAMSWEQLSKEQSGILIVDAISGNLVRKSRFELLLDDGYWPSFATERSRSPKALWDQVGEGFVKELDFCGVWLRLNDSEDGDKEDILGELRMTAKEFLSKCWNKEAEFVLTNDRGYSSTIKLISKYVPVPVTLEPRESINNMGSLRVDLLSGHDLIAADRGGKSDPYAVFTLNGQKVFKSEVIKKTLNPVWNNQSFVSLVPSRVAAKFSVEVHDWDQMGTSDLLGTATIDLTDIEPLEAQERTLPLYHPKQGQKGQLKISMVFTPQIVAKSRKATTTFAMGTRAMTQVATLPFGATLGVAKGVGHGVGAAGGLAKGLFNRKPTLSSVDGEPEGFSIPVPPLPVPNASSAAAASMVPTAPSRPLPAAPVPPGLSVEGSMAAELPSGQVSQPVALTEAAPNGSSGLFPTTNTATFAGQSSGPPDSGTIKVTVASAKDLSQSTDIKPYVLLKVGRKEFTTKHTSKTFSPDWNEQFAFNVGPAVEQINLYVYDHKTLGKDKHLGIADIDIWRHIQLGGSDPITAADVWAELREGTGIVKLRLEYESSSLSASVSSGSVNKPQLLTSPSRFSRAPRGASPSFDS